MLKHATNHLGEMPTDLLQGTAFLVKALMNLWVLAGFVLAFIGSLAWIAAVSKLDLSFAYPFTSLGFVLVVLLSRVFFGEPVGLVRFIGVLVICLGVFLVSRS